MGAATEYARLLPLINYENRQCGLIAAKVALVEGRVMASEAVRHPLRPLHPATRAGLLEIARRVNPLALTWGH
jgi:2-keto-3-deoxy-L-arabinonate dehydratase